MTGVLRLGVLGVPLGLSAFLTTACGPFTYVSRVTFGASPEHARAKVTRADRMAPYEFTAATEYLQKSKELAGYARFHDANTFGRKAKQMAEKAQKVAQRRERNGELAIYVNDGSMYITRDGAIRKGSPGDAPPEIDAERPNLDRIDNERPDLNRKGDRQ